MIAPCLEGRPDVVVVELQILFQTFGVAEKGLAVYLLIEEESEGGRTEEVLPLTSKLLGTCECIDHDMFCCHRSLVEIYLPIHEAATHEIVLYGIEPFLVHNQLIIRHVEHVDDA